MLRWLMLLVSIAAFTTAFRATETATLGWSLLVGFIALVAAFLGFAAARVASVSAGQHHRELSLLVTSRGKVAPAQPGRPGAMPREPEGPVPPGQA